MFQNYELIYDFKYDYSNYDFSLFFGIYFLLTLATTIYIANSHIRLLIDLASYTFQTLSYKFQLNLFGTLQLLGVQLFLMVGNFSVFSKMINGKWMKFHMLLYMDVQKLHRKFYDSRLFLKIIEKYEGKMSIFRLFKNIY